MATANNSVDYFSHDKHMRHDPKVNALRNKFPGWGYAIWCMLLEEFCDRKDRTIEWNTLNKELLAADFKTDVATLEEIVDYAVNIELLQIEDGTLMSKRFQERFERLDNRREQKSENGRKGAEARWKNRNGIAQDGGAIATAENCHGNEMQEKSRVEKSKETSSSFSSSSKPEEKAEAEEQQQEIISNFFFRNFNKPNAEFKKFLAWNNSGGRKWSDMDSIQRRAAAEQWQQKDSKPRFPQKFLDMWGDIYAALFDADASDVVMDAALDDKIKWEDNRDGNYTLWCPKVLYDFIELENKGQAGFLSTLKPIISKYYAIRRLNYKFTD